VGIFPRYPRDVTNVDTLHKWGIFVPRNLEARVQGAVWNVARRRLSIMVPYLAAGALKHWRSRMPCGLSRVFGTFESIRSIRSFSQLYHIRTGRNVRGRRRRSAPPGDCRPIFFHQPRPLGIPAIRRGDYIRCSGVSAPTCRGTIQNGSTEYDATSGRLAAGPGAIWPGREALDGFR